LAAPSDSQKHSSTELPKLLTSTELNFGVKIQRNSQPKCIKIESFNLSAIELENSQLELYLSRFFSAGDANEYSTEKVRIRHTSTPAP
jgi:hypothetical protein